MTPDELYRFDLEGFLVVPGALPQQLLAALAPLVDACQARVGLAHGQPPGEPPRERRVEAIALEHEVFLDAVLCPAVLSRLPRLVPLPRLRSTWLDFKPCGAGIGHHANHTPYEPRDAYHFADGRILAPSLVACFALADVPEDGAALELIPGSHKSNFPLPTDPRTLAAIRRRVPMRAGDALLFSHDVNHGCLNEREYVRRTLFATFAPSCSVNRQGGNDLHHPLFERAPEGSWRKYLLRDAGPFDTYPQPARAPEDDAPACVA